MCLVLVGLQALRRVAPCCRVGRAVQHPSRWHSMLPPSPVPVLNVVCSSFLDAIASLQCGVYVQQHAVIDVWPGFCGVRGQGSLLHVRHPAADQAPGRELGACVWPM